MQKPAPILILTPLPLELKHLLKGLEAETQEQLLAPSQVHWLKSASVAFAVGGHGKVNFALSTQHLIRELRPRLVCGVGSAGALKEDLQLGDVVIAEKIVEHDHLVKFVQQPLPQFAPDPETLRELRQLNPRIFKLHCGPVASGDEDVIEPSRKSDIQKRTQALAVAWEGAGLARACHWSKTPFLEVRVITDTVSNMATLRIAVFII